MLHLPTNIKIIRKLFNQNQEEFVKQFTGISVAMQKSYESGKAKPSVLYLNELSNLSGIAVNDLQNKAIDGSEVQKVEKGESGGGGTAPSGKRKVFVSHSSEDAPIAEIVREFLAHIAEKDKVITELKGEIEKVDKHLDNMTTHFSDLTRALLMNQKKLLKHFQIPPAPLKDDSGDNHRKQEASHRESKKQKRIGEDSGT